MASKSLGTLTIDLIAKTGGFERGMDRAGRSAKKTGKDIENSLNKSIDSAARSLRNFAGIAGIGFSVQQITQYADAFTGLQNRLRLVTDSQGQLAKATTDLFDISLRTAQNIDSTAQVYQRFAQNADRLGLSLSDVADLTDTVSKAVAISGSSAESAQAALVQFGQALASGTLRGEELNSILEQAPGLANALAEGLGVTVGQLRDLGKEGKITSDAIISALRTAADSVNEQFGTRVLTIGQGFENLRTAVTEYVGRLDSAAGATNSLAEAIDRIAHSISDASRSMGDIGREVDAVKELFVVLDDFSEDFLKGFKGGTEDVTQYFQTSFADSFLATARELDGLWDAFDGSARALEALFDTATENIGIAFSNVFNSIRESFSELVSNIAQGLNSVLGTDLDTGIWVGPGVQGFKSLSEAAQAAYAEGGKTLSLYDDLSKRLANSAINRSLAAEGYTTGIDNAPGSGRSPGASGSGGSGGGKSKKGGRSEDLLGDFIKDLEAVNKQAEQVFDSLRTQEEAIRDSYDRRRELILASTIATEEEKAEALKRLEQETNDSLLEINGSYWEKYLAAAEDSLTSFDELANSVMENFSTQVGNAFESMVFDSENLGDAVSGLAESMARSVINALGQMAAQWLAYQAVQLVVGKTTQASGATALSANASATALQAGLAAFASTAAIPIVGPALAPAAMSAALAATMPIAAGVATLALSGMAHDGIDAVPETGTWLLQKGERVVTSQTSAKLDSTLDRIGAKGSGQPVINIIENPDRAGQVDARTRDDSEMEADVFVADIFGDGRRSRALQQAFGLTRVGR